MGSNNDSWSGTLAFILASIGSAVGLGNLWRFPYIMGQYGGGNFIIVYLICVLLVGIPLMLIEISIGRRFKKSLAGTFDEISKKYRMLWLIPFVLMIIIMSFYVVVSGWTLNYAVNTFLGNTMHFAEYSNTYSGVYYYWIVIMLTCIIVMAGVKSGIERVSKLLVPMLFIIALGLAVFSISLPNSSKGLDFYFKFEPQKLFTPDIWLIAIAQAVFSLSVGYGLMLTYASYVRTKESLLKVSLVIASADTSLALLAGLFIFPAVFAFGYNPSAGTALAFTVLPSIFEVMPYGALVGTAFFILLFIAALTSCIAFLEFIVSNLEYKFKLTRKTSVLAAGIVVSVLAIPSAFSYTPLKVELLGKPFLDAVDFYFVSLGAPISILVICSLLWVWNMDDYLKELDGHTKIIGRHLYFWCKYIIPLTGVILFLLALQSTFGWQIPI